MGASAKAPPPDKSQQAITDGATTTTTTWASMTHRQKISHVLGNITVEPMVGLYIMPSVLASLATQNLNLEKSCKVNLAYPPSVCDALAARNTSGFEAEETRVQQLVAGMQIWKTALQSFFPSILILFLGAWSDRTGLRKPCMLLPICGEFLTSISLIVCTYFFYELPMEYGGFLESFWPSITGGWFTMIMGTFSYIGDITSVESRTVRIGCVNSFLSLGIPIGMALSGVLYVQLGFYGVFGIAAACYVAAFTYGVFVVKEAPRAGQMQRKLSSGKVDVAGITGGGGGTDGVVSASSALTDFFAPRHVRETFRVGFKNGPRNRRKRVIVLMLICMILIGPMYGEMAVMYLFARYRFKWNEVQFSFFSTYSMVINLIGTLFAVGVFSHFFKMDDAMLGILSCLSKILSSFVYAFATTDWMIYLAPLVEIINGTSFIVMRSITSKLVPPDELGKVNSLFGVCEAVVPLIYGPMYSSVYGATVHDFPGLFFLLGAVLMIPSLFAFGWLYMEHRKDAALDRAELNAKAKEVHMENGLKVPSELAGFDNAAFESEKL